MSRIIFMFVLAITSLALCGCDLLAPDRREFVVQIDSVTGPAAVSGGAAFQQLFYGPLGPDGCYSFKSFQVTRTTSSVDVTVLGEQQSGHVDCTQSPVYLSGRALTISPAVSDPFTLRVHQRNGAVLTKIIRVQ
jgi:hypothetical protein